MAFTELSYEVSDHIGLITLRRPEATGLLTFLEEQELASKHAFCVLGMR